MLDISLTQPMTRSVSVGNLLIYTLKIDLYAENNLSTGRGNIQR